MKIYFRLAGLVIVFSALIFPGFSLASGGSKTLSGVVTEIGDQQIIFTNGTAATYNAVLNNATLQRKNGAAMQFAEILVGDKVQVTGTLWNDNSMNVNLLRDLSLYAHNSTFDGKITTINPTNFSFTMQSKNYGNQTISTNNFTTFSKNGSSATFNTLQLGMSVSVKGQWDRNQTNVLASQVAGIVRYINIYFTGGISQINGNSLTVIGNGNVIYGVDLSQAKIENKSGGAVALPLYHIGDNLRVWGKHISGSVQIFGTEVRDGNITK